MADLLVPFDGAALKRHITALASDDFGGRFPNTEVIGEKLTLAYLEKQFKQLGVGPGNPDGSYTQRVPLMEISSKVELAEVKVGDTLWPLKWIESHATVSKREAETVVVKDAPLVWAGYGIESKEWHWNDFEHVDVRGKVLLVLANDPGFRSQDASLFRGRTLTYPGRWTYKYEEASRRGAAGVLIVHETGAAGYPWSVVVAGRDRPHVSMVPSDKNKSRVAFEGWITADGATHLLKLCGQDYSTLKLAAHTRQHRSFELANASLSMTIKNELKFYSSHNFVARIPGAERPDEYVIFSAHWDHLGKKEDQVFSGAVDNASGVAGLLELARVTLAEAKKWPCSVLFFASTAEEQGLLGAEWYVDHPLYPLAKTLGILNMDMLNIFGPVHDISFYGWGQGGLESFAEKAAAVEARKITEEPNPQDGLFFRSDHYPFCKKGVRGLMLAYGVQHKEKGEQWLRSEIRRWYNEYYHKPADKPEGWWDMRGMEDDLRLLWRIGRLLAFEQR